MADAELAVIISQPTNGSGISVLLQSPQKEIRLNKIKIKTLQKSRLRLPYL